MILKLSNKSILFIKLLVTIFILLPIIYILHKMATATTFAGVAMYGFYLLALLYLFGSICSCMFSGTIATNFIDFLLYPKQYIKEPSVILSRQEGLIAFQQYHQAEQELLLMQKAKPYSPEIAILLAKLHWNYLNNSNAAIIDYECYIKNRKLRYNPLNIEILFTLVEHLIELQEFDKAINLLKKEQRFFIYKRSERKAIKSRLSVVWEINNNL